VADSLTAEALQQAGGAVGGENFRRRQAAGAQRPRHGDERRHIVGEMRDRAIGLAVAHRRSVRPLRRIHQDVAFALEREPLIDAGRSVALHVLAVGLRKAGAGQEIADCGDAFGARRHGAVAGDARVAESFALLRRQS